MKKLASFLGKMWVEFCRWHGRRKNIDSILGSLKTVTNDVVKNYNDISGTILVGSLPSINDDVKEIIRKRMDSALTSIDRTEDYTVWIKGVNIKWVRYQYSQVSILEPFCLEAFLDAIPQSIGVLGGGMTRKNSFFKKCHWTELALLADILEDAPWVLQEHNDVPVIIVHDA